MTALRHKETHALAIVPDCKVEMFLEAGYQITGQDTTPAPNLDKPKKRRSTKKVTEDATDADGSMQ